jgi:hypothetical protein
MLRGFPSSVPSRVEVVRTVVRFRLYQHTDGTNVETDTSASSEQPVILWHPAAGTCHLMAACGSARVADWVIPALRTRRSGAEGEGPKLIPTWVDDHVTVEPPETASDHEDEIKSLYARSVAAAVGHPSVLPARSARVIGGALRVKVSCGPTVSGLMRWRVLAGEETHSTMKTIEQSLRHPKTPRLELPRSTIRAKTLYAPLNNPTEYGEVQPMNESWIWGTEDPFGAVALGFYGVEYARNMDTAPVVEVTSVVTMQLPLVPDISHLRTGHAVEPAPKKKSVFQAIGEGAEAYGGWEAAAALGRVAVQVFEHAPLV